MLDNLIIIPYRAREKQLKYFIDNSVPLLKKHIPNGKIIIVEQDWNNKLFNRGCLINIGAKEYENTTKHIMTHDIDINPCEKTIIDYYIAPISENTIKGIYTSVWNTLGGIIKMPIKVFVNINGFPNDIWGWGSEDIALQKRAEFFKKKINKNILNNDPNQHNFFLRFNNTTDKNPINNMKNIRRYQYISQSNINCGLNSLQYKILERKNINDYVELIKVSI